MCDVFDEVFGFGEFLGVLEQVAFRLVFNKEVDVGEDFGRRFLVGSEVMVEIGFYDFFLEKMCFFDFKELLPNAS